MVERVFILRSRLGRSVYALREDTLEITSYLFGRKREAVIPLRKISTEYEVRSARALRGVVLLLVPVAGCIVAYRWLLHHPAAPEALRGYPLYIGAIFAFAAFRLYPRFESFVFKDHFNRPLFTILRERHQKSECEGFVHALLDRLEARESGAEVAAAPAAETEPPHQPVALWQVAVAASAASLVVPPVVNQFWPAWDGTMILLVIVCSGGAIVAGLYSWGRKEPRRWWALAALLLALIPVLFY